MTAIAETTRRPPGWTCRTRRRSRAPVPRVPRPGGLRAAGAGDVRGDPARTTSRSSRRPSTCASRTRATTGSRRPTTSSSPRSTASPSRSAGGRADRPRRRAHVRDLGLHRPRRPPARDRPALLARNLARVHERAATVDPGLPVVIGAHAEDGEVGDRILAETTASSRSASFFLMRRDLLGADPGRPAARRDRAPAGHRGPAPRDLRRRGRGLPRPLGPSRVAARTTSSDVRAHGARHRPVGRSPGMATRSPASSRTGSGPTRTPSSASSAAGSRTSASAGRGAGAASPARSPPSRSGGSAMPA